MHSSNVQYQPALPHPPVLPPNGLGTVLPHEKVLGHRRPAGAQSVEAVHELNVSGVRILLGLGLTIGLAGLFLWGFVRDWLFAP
jgi:hypothetical protein